MSWFKYIFFGILLPCPKAPVLTPPPPSNLGFGPLIKTDEMDHNLKLVGSYDMIFDLYAQNCQQDILLTLSPLVVPIIFCLLITSLKIAFTMEATTMNLDQFVFFIRLSMQTKSYQGLYRWY